jgi:FAD/FMN-containing dehydrogenase
MRVYESWGRYPALQPGEVKPIYWRDEIIDFSRLKNPVLAYAWGRSYGDSCLNEGGILLDVSNLNRLICFDDAQGLFRCEAGLSLADILEIIVPRGWFLPVTPGTKYVSVGGAIANDIHGKNHHRGGTFGCHVTQFELVRSNGEHLLCSPTQNEELYRATIGGLGLTGIILWAEFKLKPIQNSLIDVEDIRFGNLDEFFEISSQSDQDYEYTVSWVDCLATGKSLGRGVFMRGNHNPSQYRSREAVNNKLPGTVPLDAPSFLLNGLTMKVFNTTFYYLHFHKRKYKTVPYDPFFYPLDKVDRWNKLYGKRGFLQYQFVVPNGSDNHAIREILERISASGQGSFLAVLKEFGHITSPGMLSFPRPGVTLALDFAFHGENTLKLLNELDQVVEDYGGAIYPAKDARMSAAHFQKFYPNWREFARYIDPKFSSSFWRRVTGEGA